MRSILPPSRGVNLTPVRCYSAAGPGSPLDLGLGDLPVVSSLAIRPSLLIAT